MDEFNQIGTNFSAETDRDGQIKAYVQSLEQERDALRSQNEEIKQKIIPYVKAVKALTAKLHDFEEKTERLERENAELSKSSSGGQDNMLDVVNVMVEAKQLAAQIIAGANARAEEITKNLKFQVDPIITSYNQIKDIARTSKSQINVLFDMMEKHIDEIDVKGIQEIADK